jgi:hypothetical protein
MLPNAKIIIVIRIMAEWRPAEFQVCGTFDKGAIAEVDADVIALALRRFGKFALNE